MLLKSDLEDKRVMCGRMLPPIIRNSFEVNNLMKLCYKRSCLKRRFMHLYDGHMRRTLIGM